MENQELQTKIKTFWEKPEGKTGMVAIAAMVGALGYGLFLALPFLLTLVGNTIALVGMGAVLAGMLYVLFNKNFQNLLGFGFKLVMKKLTSLFVRIDPIAIMEIYIGHLKESYEKMREQVSLIRGQIVKLREKIAKQNMEIDNNLKLASKAYEKNDKKNTVLNARQAERVKKSNVNLNDLLAKMEKMHERLSHMAENADFLIQDMQAEVALKKDERDVIYAGYSAISSARKIFQGDADKVAIFEESIEVLATDLGNKVGEMEEFMDGSKFIMDSIDLQNDVYNEEGLKLLEQWESKSDSLLLNTSKSVGVTKVKNTVDSASSTGVESGNKYKNLLDD